MADGIPNRTPNDPCLGITKKIGDQQRRKCKISSSSSSKELHLKCKGLHQKWMKCKRADGTKEEGNHKFKQFDRPKLNQFSRPKLKHFGRPKQFYRLEQFSMLKQFNRPRLKQFSMLKRFDQSTKPKRSKAK